MAVRPRIVQRCLALERMQAGVLASSRILPGMGHVFLDLRRILRSIGGFPTGHAPARHRGAHQNRCCGQTGKVPVGQEVSDVFAAREPILVAAADGDEVRQVTPR